MGQCKCFHFALTRTISGIVHKVPVLAERYQSGDACPGTYIYIVERKSLNWVFGWANLENYIDRKPSQSAAKASLTSSLLFSNHKRRGQLIFIK